MKKKPFPAMIVGAAVLGIVAVFIIISYVNSIKAQSDADTQALREQIQKLQSNPVTVVAPPVPVETKVHGRLIPYAKLKIAAGQKISTEALESKDTPDDLFVNALTPADAPGKFARKTIEAGDPITANNTADKVPFMADAIPPGYRAMALQIWNDPSTFSTGGWVNDGDHVDLILTYENPVGSKQTTTKTVLQNVRVLYVPGAQRSDKTDSVLHGATPGSETVTFEATPAQVEQFVALESAGKLRMALRSRFDTVEVRTKGVDSVAIQEDPTFLQKNSNRSIDDTKETAIIAEQNKAESERKSAEDAARLKRKADEGRIKMNTPQ